MNIQRCCYCGRQFTGPSRGSGYCGKKCQVEDLGKWGADIDHERTEKFRGCIGSIFLGLIVVAFYFISIKPNSEEKKESESERAYRLSNERDNQEKDAKHMKFIADPERVWSLEKLTGETITGEILSASENSFTILSEKKRVSIKIAELDAKSKTLVNNIRNARSALKQKK